MYVQPDATMQGSIYDVMNNLLEQIEKEIKEKMQ